MAFKEIEDWLKKQEKRLNGQPIYRLVWSDTQTEKRFGTFTDFTPGGLFIREITETRETRKYNYIHERWILEKFSEGRNAEISTDEGGTYEPFWVFEDGKGNYIDPSLKVVQFIVEFARSSVKASPGERKALIERAEEEEVKEYMNELEGSGRTPIESLLHTREGISMYFKRRQG